MILRLNILLALICLSLTAYCVEPHIVANDYSPCGIQSITMQAVLTDVAYTNTQYDIQWFSDAACTQWVANGQLQPSNGPGQMYKMYTFTATHTQNTTYYLAYIDRSNNQIIIPHEQPKSVITINSNNLHLDFDPASLKLCGRGGKATIRFASTHPPVEFQWYASNKTTLLGKTTNSYWETPALAADQTTFYVWVPGYMCEMLAVVVRQASEAAPSLSVLQESVACPNSMATVRALGAPLTVRTYWYGDEGWALAIGEAGDLNFQTMIGTTTENFSVAFKGADCYSQVYNFSITPQVPATPANQAFTICPAADVTIQPSGSFQSLQWYDEQDNFIMRSPSLRIRGMGDKKTHVYKVAGVYGSDCLSPAKATITVNGSGACDDLMNWTETVLYDSGNVMIGDARTYYDQVGQPLQSQSKSLSRSDAVIVAQTVNDRHGRPVLTTLPAPTAKTAFQYDHYFMSSSATSRYGVGDFDTEFTVENPAPVLQASGSLGWYYSSANTLEQNVPTTAYPYSRAEFYNDGTGESKREAGPGDVFRLGTGHQTVSALFPVFHELDAYLALRRIVGIDDLQSDNTLQSEGMQSVVRDANGKYTVSISDMSGKVVLAGMAGTEANNGHVLAVENNVTSSADPQSPDYRSMTYFYILTPQKVAITGSGLYSIYNMITEKPYTPPAGDANWDAGFYRIKLTQGTVTLNYTNYYQDVSCQFYNNVGRLLSSVSPNGFKRWVANRNILNAADLPAMTADYNDSIAKTTYSYNFQGWLLEMTEPDAGKTQYKYRKDGSIRFSQSAEQRLQETKDEHGKGRFSFTSYDKYGRPIQSGEYAGTTLEYADLNGQLELVQQDTFDLADKHDWVSAYYDFPDAKFSGHTHLPPEYVQTYTYGAVSYTKNANIQTWYSYDERGRVTWMAQKPKGLPLVFVVKYRYDFSGNVRTVSNLTYAWTTGVTDPKEQFYHHYEYDYDKRLSKVYTSQLRYGPRKLRAAYEYYLHGPLKRIELGNELQGVDFVYNIQGWLAQINHPDNNQDPGNDGAAGDHSHFQKDVFGMLLNYFESEFQDLFKVSSRQPSQRQPFDPLQMDGMISPAIADLIQPAYMTSATVREQINAYKPGDYSAAKPLFRELLNQFFAKQSVSLKGYEADAEGAGEFALGEQDRAAMEANSSRQLTGLPDGPERRFLVDFGDPATPTLDAGWNNMTSGLTGAVSAPLIDAWGDASGIQIEIVKNASNGFGNGNYYNPDGYTGQVRDYPPSAARDSYFAYGPGGIYKLKGLDPTKYYTLTIFGSRTSTTIPNRVGAYTINVQRKTLSAANNSGETVSFYNLRPTAAGEIVMDFNAASGSQFGYINVLDMVEKDAPGIQGPGTLTAELVNRKGQLYWTDNANNEMGYYIERRNADDAVFSRIGSVAANITQYTDIAVSVGQVYEYRVSAYNNVEESLFSPAVSLEVPGVPDKRYLIDFGNPAFPTTGTGWNSMPSGLPGSVLTNMVDSQGNTSAIDFEVIVDASAGFAGDGVYYNTVGYNGQVLDYPASACLDSYFSFGNGGVYKLKDLDTSKLYSITIFGSRVSSKNDRTSVFVINGVRQTLDAANNSSRTVTFYHMVPDSLGQITIEFGVDKDSFLGYMNVLDMAEVTIPIVETPASLVALGSLSGVALTWSDVATNETGYRIERKLPGETLFTMIGEVGPDVTTYTDSKTLTGTAYIYRVYATYGEVHSAFSNTVSLTTPGNPPDRRYLIDFGSPNYLTTLPGWNNITSPLEGYTLSNIIDSNSNSSSIGVQIVKVASNGFGNGDVFNAEGYVGQVGDYPPSATRDSFFAYGPGGTYKLLGLNPGRFYSITLFGSRISSVANRTGTYSINGKQYQLAANDNQTRTITFYNLVPNASGQLELVFGVAAGSTHGYLGVMDIRETTTPTMIAPSNLTLQQDGRFAALQWTDNAANETGYMIERRSLEEAVFKVIGKTAAGISQFTDGVLATGRSFEYRVVSYLAKTQPVVDTVLSAYSNTVSVTTPGVPSRRFLIDFGDPQTATTEAGWNNMAGGTIGSVLNNMIDSNGGASSIGAEIVKDAWNNYGSPTIYYNTTGYTGPERVFGYPLTATRDSYFAYAAGGVYKLKGLNPDRYYTITIFGSRQGTDAGRVGSYIIHGEKKTLDGADNKTRRITFEQVKPNRAGEIVLDFGVETGSQFGYLNVMDFAELSVPELEPPVLERSERLAGSAGVKITWSDNTAFEQSYQVYRSTTAGGVFVLLATQAANTVIYTDATAAPGQTYYYRVRGIRTGAVTPYSNTLISDNAIDVPVLAPVKNVVTNAASTMEVLLSAQPGGNIPMDRKNIVILGSSTAEGYGASPIGNSWANQLGKALQGYNANWNLINLAVYGYKSEDIMPSGKVDHNITKALTYNPLLVIVNLPSNDLAGGVTPETFMANLTTIKQLAENAGARVLITTTQPRSAQTLAERQVYQTVANTIKTGFGTAAIDVYTPLAAADLTIQAAYNIDGVHVNNAGHGVLYNTIRPKVESILNKTRLEFTLTNAPSFARLEPQDDTHAKLILSPGTGHVGVYNNVNLSVIDKNGNYDEQTITIRVKQSDATPPSDYRLKPLYNGLISAVAWRTESPLSNTPLTGMYLYEYDDRYQIKNANWANPDFHENDFALTGNRFRLTGMAYDANGNIRVLHRYDAGGVNTHSFDYKYAYDADNGTGQAPVYNNRLTSIAGYVNQYKYNEIGQLTGEDRADGASQYIEYDVSRKVTKVFRDADKTQLTIRNLYDDRGFRLAKVSYTETSARTTWYIRDASGIILSIYEQEGEPGIGNTHQLDQTEVPVYGANKLGTFYPNQDGSMAYEITDHLGNVRALIRDNVNVYAATMEDSEEESTANPRVEEMQYFENLFGTAVEDARMNHTSPMPEREENPDKAAYLYWVDGTQGMAADKAVGPSIALKVKPGDKISLKTWARYEEQADYTSDVTLALFAQFLGTDLSTIPGLDGVPVSNPTGVFESALVGLPGEGEDATQPRAFLNYIVFDENMVGVAAHRVQVSELAGFDAGEIATPTGLEELQDSVEITTNGYIYVWVSNGSEGTKVWFDDLTVVHTGGLVTQATDYGVWGDLLREEKLDETKYRFGYQGQYAEKDEETGWNHFELREYDAMIGRFTRPDPMGQFWSPYVGMGNEPVSGVDPTGGCTDSNGNPIQCPDGIPEVGNENTTILDEVVVLPDLLDKPGTIIRTTGYYGPYKDFDYHQQKAAYEGAVVLSFAWDLFKSQFVSENTSDDPNVIAMAPPIFGAPRIPKIARPGLFRATEYASKSEVDRIAKNMMKEGWVGEAIHTYALSDGTQVILNGHHRVQAAAKARIEVHYIELTLEEAKSLYNWVSEMEIIGAIK